MKYLMMVKLDPHTDEGRRYETGTPPDPRLLAAIGKHAERWLRPASCSERAACFRAPEARAFALRTVASA